MAENNQAWLMIESLKKVKIRVLAFLVPNSYHFYTLKKIYYVKKQKISRRIDILCLFNYNFMCLKKKIEKGKMFLISNMY